MSVGELEAPSPCPVCGEQFASPDESVDGLPRCPGCQYTRVVGSDDLTCPSCGGWLYDAVLLRPSTNEALCAYCRAVLMARLSSPRRSLFHRSRLSRAPQSAFPPGAGPSGHCRWCAKSFSAFSFRSSGTARFAAKSSAQTPLSAGRRACRASDRVVLERPTHQL
jgi:hypothetical protein